MSDYKYLIFDAQYFLTRNFKQLSGYVEDGNPYIVDGKELMKPGGVTPYKFKKPKFNYLDLSKSFFWSIAKFCREIADCEKVILTWDKYPYHRQAILQDYKGDRYYASEEDLEGLDPISDVEQIINTQLEVDLNKIKQEAKWFIVKNFGNLGMKSYVKTGYEADDWGKVISEYLYKTEPEIKSAIVSIDSDWKYLIQPNIDYIKPRGEKVTYEELMESIKENIGELKLSAYEYKSMIDSLYGSHNCLYNTLGDNSRTLSVNEILSSILDSDELLKDPECYYRQMKSFSVKDFDEYDNVIKSLYYLDKSGHISDMIEYGSFTGETGFGVTPNYYSNFVNGLNPKLYLD